MGIDLEVGRVEEKVKWPRDCICEGEMGSKE